MKEEKLKEIPKEKLDDIYIDDKEITKKIKKRIKQKQIKKIRLLILWIMLKKMV